MNATPGRGTDVPLYILGSSLFGATLAAALGLPYGFASHFAPDELERAEKELEKVTHEHVDRIDKALGRKEAELLEV